MNRSDVNRWFDAFLGADRRQRVRVKQSLVAAVLYLGIGAILGLGVWMGRVPAAPAAALVAAVLCVSAMFYAAIRSGYNLRFPSDAALARAQGAFCVIAAAVAYVIAGPIRGAMLMTLLLGQFFGVFALKPSQARQLALAAVLVMGATMAAAHALAPSRFPLAEELLHFLMLALALPSIGWLAGQLSEMRSKLRHQKVQLEAALTQNRLLATQDELTGLSNRRHMTALMTSERGRQQRNRAPISMVLMDIDHFKRINDQHGHQSGDLVLQIFADVITHGLRGGDSLARWGGEEFLLMLPGTAADDALLCVERMRMQLASRSFEHIAPGLAVTFSAGIGMCALEDRLDTTIERADRAMHQAKTTGRNRTVVA